MMRVCILTDEEVKDFDPAPYMQGFDWKMVTMTDPVLDVLRELEARNEFDVYLNLCEGYENEARSTSAVSSANKSPATFR